MQTISITPSENKKQKPADDSLVFGRQFTDHMFIMDYEEGRGWYDPRVVPYQPLEMDPAAMIFHYGQTVFEGLKAYRTKQDTIQLFRPAENIKRLNRSNARMCIPTLDESMALEAIQTLVDIDRDWVPHKEGTSLYIRPFVIATEPYLGVSASKTYTFMIILSPVGAYYEAGINPVKIAVENEYIRAVKGGTGEAKTAGNYAGSMIAQENVAKKGYAQVLWLDGHERKYIEEVGSMNVFFKIGDKVVTPHLSGSILPGVTRKSVIQLLKDWGITVEERPILLSEILDAHKNGQLEEAFGSGTAAVISPMGELFYNDQSYVINHHTTGALSKRVYDTLTGIQYGTVDDPHNWIVDVPKK
ncbi:branched-chain-amino-acid aminotransferase 2 [Halolactibacillus miurensis]|uniref:Branched-chain-amino-acid aminotransferase n=1 Tax=Halolactibacillus miurensis TaxID=306541 RepID=A0A1I6T3L0_9BACI|nr:MULTISPECIES: branched-chain amino acid aminotransferase [Halolactibacillus]GEM04992.1 branched-chain-amino-acid aminotransferase 2 [Halolactibacillus miurensis]SFS83723.1 branched-chain amino acid aminotransferase [Halolactibacillus miurensis]